MEEITVQPTYLDVTVKSGGSFYYDADPENTLFIYIINGSLIFLAENSRMLPSRETVLFERGDRLHLKSGSDEDARLLLFSGKPLNEPIEWDGPIVMSTKEELNQAFKDIEKEFFIKEHLSDGTIRNKQVNENFYK